MPNNTSSPAAAPSTAQLEFPPEGDLTPKEQRAIDALASDAVTRSPAGPQLDVRTRLKNFNTILNRKPPASIVRTMQSAGQSFSYMPIRYYERLMKQLFFGLVVYEIVDYRTIFNEIVVHTRVKYFHPVTEQWLSVDGLAAHQIMQDKDTKVADFAQFKKPNALKTVLPACYSESIKNALKKMGAIFGGDINRKPEDDYDAFSDKVSPPLNA